MPFINYNSQNINFVHIPKTGGTTVEVWLGALAPLRFKTTGVPAALKYTPQHFTYTDLRTIFGEDFFHYSFCIVRNPYERFASEYRMQHILGQRGFWKAFESFPAWVETVTQQLRNQPWMLDAHLRPQWQFVSNAVNVFKYEDGLETILKRVAKVNSLPPLTTPLPRHTDSEAFTGKVVWDTKEIETVRALYQRDFDIFGYDIDRVPGSEAPVK